LFNFVLNRLKLFRLQTQKRGIFRLRLGGLGGGCLLSSSRFPHRCLLSGSRLGRHDFSRSLLGLGLRHRRHNFSRSLLSRLRRHRRALHLGQRSLQLGQLDLLLRGRRVLDTVLLLRRACPGRQPQFWAVKRPARPCKSPTQNRLTIENAKAA
jgi:hypothetical protein